MKIRDVIEKLVDFHPPLSPQERENGTDVFKCGDPERECTGVAVTCYASYNVVKAAAEQGLNLIIVHEPSFYNHRDETDSLADNEVYAAKRKILDEHGICIWRDHDHIHAGPQSENRSTTDMIFYGIMKTLGWERYLIGDEKKPLFYRIPATTVRALTEELIEKLGLNGARIIGNPDGRASKVFFCEHIRGNERDLKAIARAEAEHYDVLIPLETVDWTLLEYVTDSAQMGRPRAVISMGHFNFEEAGMKYMTAYLPELIGQEVPVVYLPAGDLYQYIVK